MTWRDFYLILVGLPYLDWFFLGTLVGLPIGAVVWVALRAFISREFGGNWFVG
jgi:hypothetical protein